MKITFLGAAEGVTGSNYLVEAVGKKFLVDCGLFQGNAKEEDKNYDEFAFNVNEIDFMLLTHAHIDHSGRIPKLYNEGYRGPIYVDMHSDIGSAHHYAMADASGKSVVVEYVDNKMVVVESPAVANHYLCEQKLNVGLEEGDDRYDKLCQRFDETHGVMSKKQLTEAIAVVSQPMEQREQSDARIGSAESRQRKTEGQPQRDGFLGTAWSMVMDLSHPSVTYYSRRHFSKSFHFELSRR